MKSREWLNPAYPRNCTFNFSTMINDACDLISRNSNQEFWLWGRETGTKNGTGASGIWRRLTDQTGVLECWSVGVGIGGKVQMLVGHIGIPKLWDPELRLRPSPTCKLELEVNLQSHKWICMPTVVVSNAEDSILGSSGASNRCSPIL